MKYQSIAIDGPSGAGKSTLAKYLADTLGFLYVDTGAIYRTLGLHVCRMKLDPTDGRRVMEALASIRITLAHSETGGQRMYLNGEDVTDAIREHQISWYASRVSAIPEVRTFLLEMQRQFAREGNVVMDGRDIGTVVLPQADLKIYLTASPEDRARRRYLELLERGQQAEPAQVLRDVLERDRQDVERETAPLRQAADAVVLDTTGIGLEESFQRALTLARKTLDL